MHLPMWGVGGVVTNGHSHNPLTLWNTLVDVQSRVYEVTPIVMSFTHSLSFMNFVDCDHIIMATVSSDSWGNSFKVVHFGQVLS